MDQVDELPIYLANRSFCLGCLLGLAVGDAVGTTLEFKSPGSFTPITDMVGGGPFDLKPGQWTDDTSMALCLAESLIEKKAFDPKDQMDRYVRWYREGHLSSTGKCFDIGSTIRTALEKYIRSGNPFSGPTSENTAGNGSLMRLAPIAIFFRNNIELAVEMAAQSSMTTHSAPQAVDACRYLAGLMVIELNHVNYLLMDPDSPEYHGQGGDEYLRKTLNLHPEVEEVAAGSFKRREPPEIVGSGYVVKSLEAALWAFHKTSNFMDGLLLAVNLGDDADTTGAIYGQLAGAHYGVAGIPIEWIERLSMKETIMQFAEELFLMTELR